MSHSFRLTTLMFFAVILLVCLPVVAQTPYLVKDINPSTDLGSSSPSSFTQVGTSTFFVTYAPNEGYQLWKTDGTSAGTSLVIDRYFDSISSMTASGGKLFFVVSDGGPIGPVLINGASTTVVNGELWVSDGTASGTKMLRQAARSIYSGQSSLADVNGTLFFPSDDGASGNALWKTDGTDAGTVMVKAMPSMFTPAATNDLRASVASLGSPVPTMLTAVNGVLFFVTGGTNGTGSFVTGPPGALWRSDGTEAGTVIVASPSGFFAANLTSVNGTLLFTSGTASSGLELWRSDGTEAGTTAVTALGNVGAQEFTNVNGTLYFQVYTVGGEGSAAKLWKSDGTASGTGLVSDLCASDTGICATTYYLSNVDGTLFYASGRALWKSNGTAEGTIQIAADIWPSSLVALGGAVYFEGFDSINGLELWKSDGTPNGTALLKDICPGLCNGFGYGNSSRLTRAGGSFFLNGTYSDFLLGGLTYAQPRDLVVSNGKIFFSGCEPVNACEPWSSDGTSNGTALLKNLVTNTGSRVDGGADLGGSFVFGAFDGTSYGIWKSNGAESGTTLGKSTSLMPYLSSKAVANGYAFFASMASEGKYELWKTDGTGAGTSLIHTTPGTACGDSGSSSTSGYSRTSVLSYLIAINGIVYFNGSDCAHGTELWKSDGTADGTAMVKDLLPGGLGSDPTNLINANGKLFFVASDDSGENVALWKSDGTDAGTVMLKAFAYCTTTPTSMSCSSGNTPQELTAAGNLVYFTVSGKLWVSDGTNAGTQLIGDLNARALVDVTGTLFFWNSTQLWKSDGTTNGTVMVKDFSPPLPASSFSSSFYIFNIPMASVNGTLFFVYDHQLWKSDGTSDGTVPVKDMPAAGLMNVNGTLYFAGKADASGAELWKSDGTEAGTTLVADIYPGANGSWPNLLAISGTKLYFTANDETHGTELWAVGVAPTTLSLSSSSSAITVGSSITLTATIGKNVSVAPTGTVTFMDGTSILGTGTVNNNGAATLATTALTAGTHSITAVYGGDANFVGSTSAVLIQLILATSPNYTLSANPTSATVRAGGSATFVITATAEQYFNGTISFSCGTLPRGVTCNFSPATLNPTSATPARTTLTVYTTANSAAMIAPVNPVKPNSGGVLFALLGSGGVFGTLLLGKVNRQRRIVVALAVLALFVLGMTACGGGGSTTPPPQNGTPVGSASVQVTAMATAGTSAGNTTAHNLTITVNVQ